MKNLILIFAVLVSHVALAKSEQQLIAFQEVRKLTPFEMAHRELFYKISTRKIDTKAGVEQLKIQHAKLNAFQAQLMQQTKLKGALRRQLNAVTQNLLAAMRAETAHFSGRLPRGEMTIAMQNYLKSSKGLAMLIDETPLEASRRLGGVIADLQRQSQTVMKLLEQNKMTGDQAVEALQKIIPAAFKEVEEEQLAIQAQFPGDRSVEDVTAKWIRVTRLSALEAWKLGDYLRTGNEKSMHESLAHQLQSTAIIDAMRGGPAPKRQTASDI